MTTLTEPKPGDIANGYILGSDNRWHLLPSGSGDSPMQQQRKGREPKGKGRKRLMIAAAAVVLASFGLVTVAGLASASAGEQTTASAPADPASYATISDHDWALIVKDPDAHAGEQIIVYAEVSQFDSLTGTDTFRASATAGPTEYYFADGENAIFVGDPNTLAPVVEGDVVRVHATVEGSQTYKSPMGDITVPVLHVDFIEVLDQDEAEASQDGDAYDNPAPTYTDDGQASDSSSLNDADYAALQAEAEARADEIRASGGSTYEVPEDGIFSCIAPWDYMDEWTDADMEEYAQCLAAM